jgi:hypothetical protein
MNRTILITVNTNPDYQWVNLKKIYFGLWIFIFVVCIIRLAAQQTHRVSSMIFWIVLWGISTYQLVFIYHTIVMQSFAKWLFWLVFKEVVILFRKGVYPRCNSHYPIMGHVKIKNNIPISPDKWIYEYDITPIIHFQYVIEMLTS